MEEKKLQKKKEKAINDNNQDQLAQYCTNLGEFYNEQGNYSKAVKEYEDAAKIYSKLENKLDKAKAHRMIGEMFMLLSEFDDALININIYLKIVKELKNKLEEQRSYATLGRAYLLNGQSISDDIPTAMKQLKKADKAFIQSLLICKELTGQINKIELLDMQARLYLNIGVVKEHMNDFNESLVYKEKAIKISKENDIFELLHLCYLSTSLLYQYKINNSTLALRYCNLALEVAERLPDKIKKICETLITKSEIMIKVDDYQSAKQILRKAYKMNTPDLNDKQNIEKTLKVVIAICTCLDSLITTSLIDYKVRKILYEKLGDGCCILQNYPKAIEHYLQMLECAELNFESNKELLPIYISLYQTYKDNKDYDKVLEYLWKEFEINKDEPTESFYTLCNIAEICEIKNQSYWTIYEIYKKAIDLAIKNENVKLEKFGLIRLWNFQKKSNMNVLAEILKEEANAKGINIEILDDDSDTENSDNIEQNTPNIGEDICLDDLSDSNEEPENLEKTRIKRTSGTSLTIKRNNKGETQLHQACISGNISLVKRLIDQGHTINVRDHAGWLPLHEACNHGYKDIVELLLDRGGNSAINDKGGTSCDGITPLYDACSNGFLDVVESLLERGANATLKTDFGDNSLNILDKWRKTVKLDECEQFQYTQIHEKLSKQFAQVANSKLSPILTNSNSKKNISDISDSDNSNDKNFNDQSDNELNLITNEQSNSEEFVESLNILKDNKKKCNARQEYKNVMKNLKNPNRSITHCSPKEIPKKRTGFLNSEEIDADSWLDDDLGPEKKKRKYFDLVRTAPESREKTVKKNDHALSLPFDVNKDSSNDDYRDAFEILIDSANKPKNIKNKFGRTLSSESNNSNRKLKNQSSLLENGFCRFSSRNSILIDDFDNILEPDSTTNYQIPNTSNNFYKSPEKIEQLTQSSALNQTVSFKIRVEDELLLVPVERKNINEINFSWLCEEASRRYYNLVGLKPILRLMTSDGFAFEETDTISAALEENMISSKVIEWKTSPLAQRYEEVCHEKNQEIDPTIRSTLENGQITNYLSFIDYCLTPNQAELIFKSILHNSALRVLDLSNNFIQNEGCKQLGKSLKTLKQLKSLNLQGNCITSDGLEYLAISNQQTLCELESINLSYNPLGNKSIRNLEKLCKNCEKITKLYLTSCSISNFYEYDLKFNELIEFDVSFNCLSIETFKNLLNMLNSCKIQYLNLNYTTKKPVGINICEFIENGTCEKLKRFEIAACNLNDSDIYKLTQNLCKSNDLEILNLSDNSQISTISLQYVFEKLPQIKKIALDLNPQLFHITDFKNLNLNCNKIPELITLHLNDDDDDDDGNLNSEMFETLKRFWLNFHGDNGKFHKVNNYICLYINEIDLNGD